MRSYLGRDEDVFVRRKSTNIEVGKYLPIYLTYICSSLAGSDLPDQLFTATERGLPPTRIPPLRCRETNCCEFIKDVPVVRLECRQGVMMLMLERLMLIVLNIKIVKEKKRAEIEGFTGEIQMYKWMVQCRI